jgi:hypothetical protein
MARIPYCRLTFSAATSDGKGKRRTVWAERVAAGLYRVVTREGDRLNELVMASPADILRDQPAVMNRHYGELEVEG